MGRLVYCLDTNIISEPTKSIPSVNVMKCLDRHNGQYAIAATVWHELWFGYGRLPDSKRKQGLYRYLCLLKENGLPILPFDEAAAQWFGEERSRLMQQGITPSYADGEIAAIANTNNLVLVSRNDKDFRYFKGLQLENWFEDL